MKTLSSPLVTACCYNICLLVDSEVIRVAQRPTRSSWNKGEQETWRKRTHTHVYDDGEGRRAEEERKRDETSGALQLLCIGARTRFSHVKIYLLPPSILYLCPLSFFGLVAVCQPSLLPFHTVITHLYIGRSSRRPLKINRVSPPLTFAFVYFKGKNGNS